MKSLSHLCPDPKKLIELKPDELGKHLLGCLNSSSGMKRANIVTRLSAAYHLPWRHKVAHAIEEALDWLIVQCFIGARLQEDIICLTWEGKKATADYKSHASH